MRIVKWLLIIVLVLAVVYLMGPHPSAPVYSKEISPVPDVAPALEQYIHAREASRPVKPDNQARIVWFNDSLKNKTEYSIVYLHGFSASQGEGDPVHRDIARKFGCNLYLSRLAEHGIDTTESMLNLTADKYWESAKEALAIGRQLGNKVILMGTSTGGTLALKLAAEYPDIHSLVLLSPNIAINDPSAFILNNPWGLQIARLVMGSKYMDEKKKEKAEALKKYWDTHYRLEAAVALEELIETSMNKETFERVKQPTLLLYFYKDEIQQDSTVKVSAMRDMFAELGTPATQKREKPMPRTGSHVIGSAIRSHDVEGVEREIEKFLTEVVGLKPL